MEITTVILDWAGTTVDFGCFAPVDAFLTAFEAYGLTPTMEETRAPMGMQKRAHITSMLSGDRLRTAFKWRYGRDWTEADVDRIYEAFEPALMRVLARSRGCDARRGQNGVAAARHGHKNRLHHRLHRRHDGNRDPRG